tara:strand:+ start:17304 stop:17735 length:432 start_codon:yes stop_codon:yes gene_type:complete
MFFKKDINKLAVVCLSFIFSSLPVLAEVNVTDAWVRLLPPMSKMTAAYMNIQSDQEDRLIAAGSDIAKFIEIHHSKMENGVMSMRQVDGLDLPQDTLVELKPQSYHFMVMGLVKPLHESESYLFTLEFEKAGKVDIQVPVRNP